MKLINLRKSLIGPCSALAVCLMATAGESRATIIYNETFSGQNGKGWIDGGPVDLAGVTWSVDLSTANMADNDENDFGVVSVSGEEQFRGSDTDGSAMWRSPVIDISSHTNVALSIDARETGTLESADFLALKYVLDGGLPVSVTSLADDFGSDFINLGTAGLAGSTLQVLVEIDNNSTGENHYFDNVTVTGDRIVSGVPDGGASFTLLMAGLIGLFGARRLRA